VEADAVTEERTRFSPGAALDELAEAIAAPIAHAMAGPREAPPEAREADFSRFDVRVWSLHRLTRNAIGADLEAEVVERLAQVPRWLRGIRAAFVAWVELIEALVQIAERRHGAGSGDLKSNEVRDALAGLHARVPEGFPPDVAGLASDASVEHSIDAVVELLNQFSLWREVDVPDWPDLKKPGMRERAAQLVARLARWVAAAATRLANALERPPRPRQHVAVAEELAARFGDDDHHRVLGSMYEALVWFRSHQAALLRALTLPSSAVQLAIMDDTLDAREQERYASDLVFASLDETGLGEALDMTSGAAELVVWCLVGATARIFRKRTEAPLSALRAERRPGARVLEASARGAA
jgi:hypothetical protein